MNKNKLEPGQLWLWEETIACHPTRNMLILLVEPKDDSDQGPGAWAACVSEDSADFADERCSPLELQPHEVTVLENGGGKTKHLEIKAMLLQEAP